LLACQEYLLRRLVHCSGVSCGIIIVFVRIGWGAIVQKGSPETLLGVQILRGIAALAVLIHHIMEETTVLFVSKPFPNWLVTVGASGVDLFFVISGFIMLYTTQRHFGRSGAAAEFILRRFIRIVPMYWICSLAIVVLASSGLAYKTKIIAADNILLSLSFLPTDNLILGVGWTLQYEIYFYAIFAFCMLVMTSRQALFAIPFALGLMIFIGHQLPGSPAQRFLANPIALEFAFGLWLAYGYSRGRWLGAYSALAALAGVAGLVVTSMWFATEDTSGLGAIRLWAWGIPAALILYSALSMPKINGWPGAILYALGNASYSIYLTHAIVMTSYAKLLKTDGIGSALPPGIWMIAAGGVAIAVGLATYAMIERPITEGLKRHLQPGAPRAAKGETIASA
jgi:exopolysaccharide production protein ExoZ